jgi:hypothetical protein
MAKEKFIEIAFRRKTVDLIQKANVILSANVEAGYTMTLRQLYYQLVQAGIIENNKNSYERLGSVMNDARRAGLVDWAAIEDRGRNLNRWTLYTDPKNFLDNMIRYYLEDIWRDQDTYVETWIEKDALIGVLERPCGHYRVPYFACRGYPSTSELYLASKRFDRKMREGKRVVLLYLGDHDPAGVDIPRSNQENLDLFCYNSGVELKRIALNMDQIEEQGIVSDQTTKIGDSKSLGYEDTYGTDTCWELDALTNQFIDDLVRAEIEALLSDPEMFQQRRDEEEANETLLREVADDYDAVRRYLKYRHTGVDVRTGIENYGYPELVSADDVLDMAEGEDDGTDNTDG